MEDSGEAETFTGSFEGISAVLFLADLVVFFGTRTDLLDFLEAWFFLEVALAVEGVEVFESVFWVSVLGDAFLIFGSGWAVFVFSTVVPEGFDSGWVVLESLEVSLGVAAAGVETSGRGGAAVFSSEAPGGTGGAGGVVSSPGGGGTAASMSGGAGTAGGLAPSAADKFIVGYWINRREKTIVRESFVRSFFIADIL